MSSNSEDDFEPKLGRSRAGKSDTARTAKRLSDVARRAGVSTRKLPRNAHWTARGKALGARSQRLRGFQTQRVIIKARITRPGPSGIGALKTHLAYLKREGVSREGSPGVLYDARGEIADGNSFADRTAGDPHQFRFIIAPEDGSQLEDLRPFVRDLMRQMEADLGTKLDWVAADHYNSGHPHSHVILRGVTDDGAALVIARDYISHGLRARAEELVTLELGPRTDLEQVHGWRRQVTQERFTPLDHWIKSRAEDQQISPRKLYSGRGTDPLAAARGDLAIQRLRQLETMGLATAGEGGRYQLAEGWEQTLRRLGERGDILKTIHREVALRNLSHRAGDVELSAAPPAMPITGRLVARVLHDELKDRHGLLVDGLDGRLHWREASAQLIDARAAQNHIVTLTRDRSGRQTRLTLLSSLDVGAQASAMGATWLDRTIVAEAAPQASTSLPEITDAGAAPVTGFAADVRRALEQRRAWLVRENLGTEKDGMFTPAPGLLDTLRQRDLRNAARLLASETGMDVELSETGGKLSGRFARRVDLASGSFAVIDREHSLTLAPWSPALEQWRGQRVTGRMIGHAIRWQPGRDIGLGIG